MRLFKASSNASTLVLVALASAHAADFTGENILVERIGNGSTALSSASAPIVVMEYTRSGSSVQSISFPTSGSNQQTDSGSATSIGYLNYYNGYLAVTGYNSAGGTASVATLNTKVTSIIDNTGNVVNQVIYPTGGLTGTPRSPFSGNNLRSAIATGSNTFYATGTSTGTPNTGGAWYYDGSAFTQLSSTNTGQPTNLRMVEIYNNQLYASVSSGTNLGILKIGNGLPTTAGQTPSLEINMGALASPYGFVMFDTNNDSLLDTAFIADDRTATGGGLNKWTFNGSAWSLQYALLFDAAAGNLSASAATGFAGIRGLAASYDASTGFSIFATTTEANNNRLVSILDTGTAPTTYTTLATAGLNNVFRGVDVMGVPEPTSASLMLLGLSSFLALRRRNPKT